MGKTSSTPAAAVSYPSYPSFSGGSISLNGDKKASVSKVGNEIQSNYNMNDYEKSMYDYAQSSLANILPKLNVFNDSTLQSINKQTDAYKQKAIESLEEIYKPMLTSLKNDIASRFGNLDNSMFMNNLGTIEDYRSSALSKLAQDVASYQSDLFNNELSNRYNYTNLLNSLVNGSQNNALNYISNAFSNSNSGNSYNMANYNAQLSNALNAAKYGSNNSTNLVNNLGSVTNLARMIGLI